MDLVTVHADDIGAAPDRAPSRSRRRSRLTALALGTCAVLLSGCLQSQVAPPAGAAPLRYRDAVFTAVTKTKDLVYGNAPDLSNTPVDLKLDLYQPTGDTILKRPAIVWVHGGGFVGGDKAYEQSIVTPLAKQGFVVVSINYRLLAPGGCTNGSLSTVCVNAATEAIHDGQAAVRWLRSKAAVYRLDTTRIGAGGFSAGAIVATGIGLLADQPGTSGNPAYSSSVGGFLSCSGGFPNGQYVDSTDAPGYFFSGTLDTTVPYQWSVDTAAALQNAGVFTVLHPLSGVGHSLPDFATLESQMTNFFYKTLRLGTAAR